MAVALEERSADDWARSPFEEDALALLRDLPEELRLRGTATVAHDRVDGRAGVWVFLGGERVRNFAFQEGRDRWSWALRVGVRRTFRPRSP